MRQPNWGWSSTGRRRWSIVLLLLGHLLWMGLGRGPSGRWQRMANLLAAPPRAASARWEDWRAARR